MSSSKYNGALAFIFLASLGAIAAGCGRSPAMPRTPSKAIGPDGQAVPFGCTDEDDDDEASASSERLPVQYVRMSEWQEPESAKRVAAEVAPRANAAQGPRGYMEFPPLTRHRPIGETTIRGSLLR